MTGGRSSCSAPTGRNFAAGMSGGMAYVLDLHEARVNREMVDLEPLDAEDADLLRVLVRRHAERDRFGGGRRAARGLGRRRPRRFTKVMPRDYKNVLLARARPLEAGFAEDSPETPGRDHGGLPWLTRRAS